MGREECAFWLWSVVHITLDPDGQREPTVAQLVKLEEDVMIFERPTFDIYDKDIENTSSPFHV